MLRLLQHRLRVLRAVPLRWLLLLPLQLLAPLQQHLPWVLWLLLQRWVLSLLLLQQPQQAQVACHPLDLAGCCLVPVRLTHQESQHLLLLVALVLLLLGPQLVPRALTRCHW